MNAELFSITGPSSSSMMSGDFLSCARRRRIVFIAAFLWVSLGAFVLTFAGPAWSAETAHGAHARTTATIHLEEPAGLAIDANGDLFIADQKLNEVLVRLPSGTLHVIAGTGTAGFSGDGGPAIDAQLSNPTAIALGENGTIYIDDEGNNRVRALLTNGRITTVAGNGKTDAASFTAGTLATTVAMPPSAVTVRGNGQLYVATNNDVVQLSNRGVIMKVMNLNATPGVKLRYHACDPEAIGFDSTGNLFVGCANSRELIERRPSGRFEVVQAHYRPHDFAGMAFTKGGALLIANGEVLFGVIDNHATALIGLKAYSSSVVCVPSGIAVSANGTIYTDCQSGDGFDTGAGLAKITPGGAIVLLRLWKEQ